ncbi:dihydrofolate reductase family protein [Litorilituus lipolyticus]|uniref:Dihydrofolate reductase n=1 Tax=Litorilituus lipolyticus TaxID=2491017 RepID=A0A502KRE9_9GAMM|nr:dihydrofolate reductase family protein [Litorilituus lipolyticus]TPH12183.1 dihydrofolate reductase [Litorilituus lipolyticus]
MKCSAFIATSLDGYIATKSGSVDWLENAGDKSVDLAEDSDMGFKQFMTSVDCMIIGRKCMEKLSSFNLLPAQWPYGDTRIMVLSNTLTTLPENLQQYNMSLYSGDINQLVQHLEDDGLTHAYIDGGTTICSFIKLQLISDITITVAPIILGEGIPLFSQVTVALEQARAKAFANNFTQITYRFKY